MTAAERAEAETYLRLMAESELRRALAYPRHEPPEPSGPLPAVRSAVRLSGPLLAPLLPPVRTAARVSGPLLALAVAGRTHRSLGRPADDSRAGGRAGSLAGAAGPPGSPGVPGRPRPLRRPPAEAGHGRVRLVASALVQAGVLGESAAQAALDGLTDALALRGRLTPGRTYGPPGSGSWGPGSRWLPESTPPPLPGGPVRAVPLGTALPLESGAGLAEAGLLALILAPDRAVLTAAVRLTEPAPGARRPGRGPSVPLPFGALVATDEHGTQYRAGLTVHSAVGRWSAAFGLTPVPPPGTRRLDVTGPAVKDPIRVDLTRVPDPSSAPIPRTRLDCLATAEPSRAATGRSRGAPAGRRGARIRPGRRAAVRPD